MASERARAAVRERRQDWIDRRRPRMRQQPARLVFIEGEAHAPNAISHCPA